MPDTPRPSSVNTGSLIAGIVTLTLLAAFVLLFGLPLLFGGGGPQRFVGLGLVATGAALAGVVALSVFALGARRRGVEPDLRRDRPLLARLLIAALNGCLAVAGTGYALGGADLMWGLAVLAVIGTVWALAVPPEGWD